MTTLRKDGYLETDDPVVVACFMGKMARGYYHDGCTSIGEHIEAPISSIDEEGVLVFINRTGDDYGTIYYPILIPAKTVAKVAGFPAGPDWHKNHQRYKLLIDEFLMGHYTNGGVWAWLRKHAGE